VVGIKEDGVVATSVMPEPRHDEDVPWNAIPPLVNVNETR
jgi:hypothetical protein